jgi:DUF1365 family protein
MKKTADALSKRQNFNQTMSTDYCLIVEREKKKLEVAVTAHDSNHAQAQAADITRALQADTFSLSYKSVKEDRLGTLFRRLASSDFEHANCERWIGSFCNGSPVIYALGRKYYVRPLILDYLEINKDGCVKPSCGDRFCINPYHNSYKKMKASKLGDADTNLVLAFSSRGVPVKEIAKALKVHRSTIYRTLNREHLHAGPAHH